MTWLYSAVKYDPSPLPAKPYVVVATGHDVNGDIQSRIEAHGATPEEARASAERGAVQIDSQAYLLWRANA